MNLNLNADAHGPSELKTFVDYVWSFYGEHEETLYPIKGLTKRMIEEATFLVLQMCCDSSEPVYTWGGGDTTDREHVRDMLLNSHYFPSLSK
mgnify:CR=1 FL=1